MDRLPTEVLFFIFDKLPKESLISLLKTSKRMRKLVVDRYCIRHLQDACSQDPLLASRCLKKYRELLKSDSEVYRTDEEDRVVSEIYTDFITRSFRCFTEKKCSVEEKELEGRVASRQVPEEMTICSDKIIILQGKVCKIYSFETGRHIRTIEEGGCLDEANRKIRISGASMLTYSSGRFQVLNLDSMEQVSSMQQPFHDDPLNFMDWGLNDGAIVVASCQEVFISSRESENSKTIPLGIKSYSSDTRIQINNEFLILFISSRPSFHNIVVNHVLLKLEFYTKPKDKGAVELSEKVWIDPTVRPLHGSTIDSRNGCDIGYIEDILLNDSNLLAVTQCHPERAMRGLNFVVNILDVRIGSHLITVNTSVGILSEAPVQWRGERLFFLIFVDESAEDTIVWDCFQSKTIAYYDVEKKIEKSVGDVTGIGYFDAFWFGHFDIIKVTHDLKNDPLASDSDICLKLFRYNFF